MIKGGGLKRVPCAEDEDFIQALDKMMLENLQVLMGFLISHSYVLLLLVSITHNDILHGGIILQFFLVHQAPHSPTRLVCLSSLMWLQRGIEKLANVNSGLFETS